MSAVGTLKPTYYDCGKTSIYAARMDINIAEKYRNRLVLEQKSVFDLMSKA